MTFVLYTRKQVIITIIIIIIICYCFARINCIARKGHKVVCPLKPLVAFSSDIIQQICSENILIRESYGSKALFSFKCKTLKVQPLFKKIALL